MSEVEEPEIPPKIIEAPTLTSPSPPRNRPTKSWQKLISLRRDPGLVHQKAHEDEERQGDQRVGVETGEHPLRQDLHQIGVVEGEEEQRRQTDRVGDGDAQDEQDREAEQEDDHLAVPHPGHAELFIALEPEPELDQTEDRPRLRCRWGWRSGPSSGAPGGPRSSAPR